jgi:replicative DNA helicase
MQYTTREADLAQIVVELKRQVFGDRIRPRIQKERRWYQLYLPTVHRARLGRLASAVGGDEHVTALSSSDIYWDSILSITPDGEEEVYDLTVPGPASFVANDFIVHNSIEQDADTVMLLHRPEMYRSSSSEPVQDEGTVEVIIAKQRNGPIGEVRLTYLKQFMRFENFAIEAPFGAG